MDGSDLARRVQQAQLKAELLGLLRRIEAIVDGAIAAGTVDAYEAALEEAHDLTCDEDDGDTEPEEDD